MLGEPVGYVHTMGKPCCVTGAKLLQMHLLFRRELDGILVQRSWHKDSPLDQAQGGRMVICQNLAYLKPAAYLLRAALSLLCAFRTATYCGGARNFHGSLYITTAFKIL